MRGVLVSSFLLVGALASLLGLPHCTAFTDATEPAADAGTMARDDAGDGEATSADGGTTTKQDGGAFGGCAPFLADGFERPTVVATGWDRGVQTSGDGGLAVDTIDPFADQQSLRADIPTGNPVSYLEATLGQRSRVRYAFALRAGSPAARTIALNSIELQVGAAHFALYFALDGPMLQLREQRFDLADNPTMQHDLSVTPLGWHTYTLTLTLTPAPAHVDLDIDGLTTMAFDLAFPLEPGVVTVRCGVGFTDDGPATAVWLDNVEVCAEP